MGLFKRNACVLALEVLKAQAVAAELMQSVIFQNGKNTLDLVMVFQIRHMRL